MHTKKIKISGTGCALGDYLYNGVSFDSPEFLKYSSFQTGDGGLSPGKLVFTEEIEKFSNTPYTKILRELTNNQSPDAFNLGGPGLVSLINASQLLYKNNFEVLFYGILGKDKTAINIINRLEANIPLDISNYKRISNKSTPFTDVLSDPAFHNNQGERTFINNIGAAWDYSPDFLDDNFFNSHIICFGGTALVPQIHDNLTSLLEKAKLKKCITVVNTVFDFRNEKKNPGKPWPLGDTVKSLKLIDLLIMDAEEAVKISGQLSLSDASAFFIEQGSPAFIITNGSEELSAYSNGSLFKKKSLSKLPVTESVSNSLPGSDSQKGDTTGCGDNFAGGAIASLAWQLKTSSFGNFDLDEVLAWAVASGGFACFYLGGTYLEKKPGEKLAKIKSLKIDYLRQISKLKMKTE